MDLWRRWRVDLARPNTPVGHGPLLAHLGAYLVGLGRPAMDLAVHQPSLESRFVELTTGAVR